MKKLGNEKGSIYLITLGIIMILSITLYSLAFNSGVKFSETAMSVDRFQAKLNAEYGLQKAKEMISKNELPDPKETIKLKLFDDPRCEAEFNIYKCRINQDENNISLLIDYESGNTAIISTGKFKKQRYSITSVWRGGKVLFWNEN